MAMIVAHQNAPSFGLKLDNFRALAATLLADERPRNSPNSGRSTPSDRSESAEISSLTTSGSSTTAESTLISSRAETPVEASNGTQRKVNIIEQSR